MFYTRDYFCSKVTKAGYAEHPVDLLILSGLISSAGHRVSLIDAIVERLDFDCVKSRIDSLGLDAIIFLSGSISWKDDFVFLRQVKLSHPDMLLIGLGDVFLDSGVFEENSWIDAAVFDFTKDEVLSFAGGRDDSFEGLCFRRGNKTYIPPKIRNFDDFTIPVPRHELFLGRKYSFPFARRLPFTTVLTDYGCPFSCPFCIYSTLGFKLRELDNVFEELRYIYGLGIKELFIKDQSFGANKERTIALCEGMRKIGKFSWTCFLRTDIAEPELLTAMKKAGCHTIIFGVESASEEILKKYKPGVNKDNAKHAFKLCRRLGIDTVGIFILGFPEEDKKSCLETIDFALQLRCDFASFNLFVPKIGTRVRKDLIGQNLLKQGQPEILDQSGIAAVWNTNRFTQKELDGLRRSALRRFYLRPSYAGKRLFKNLFSATRMKILLNSASFIFRDITGKRFYSER